MKTLCKFIMLSHLLEVFIARFADANTFEMRPKEGTPAMITAILGRMTTAMKTGTDGILTEIIDAMIGSFITTKGDSRSLLPVATNIIPMNSRRSKRSGSKFSQL